MDYKANITGKVFDKLTVLEYAGQKESSNHYYWLVQCECKEKFVVRGTLLTTKKQTCCKNCSRIKSGVKTHGLTKTRLFVIWQHMKSRCYTENTNFYERYGGRGIKINKEWLEDFKVFYDWAMSNGYSDTLTIDRIDNNGNYEPTNCRWATTKEQSNNTSTNTLITYKNKTQTIKQWSEELGINYYNIINRLYRGKWSVEKTFETPIKSVSVVTTRLI